MSVVIQRNLNFFRSILVSPIHRANFFSKLRDGVVVRAPPQPRRLSIANENLNKLDDDELGKFVSGIQQRSVIKTPKHGSSSFQGKNPVSVMIECYANVDNFLGGKHLSFNTTKAREGFSCELTVEWPSKQVFVGSATSKAKAKQEACRKALAFLAKNGVISHDGRPKLLNKTNRLNPCQATVSFTSEERMSLTHLQDHYKEIQPHFELAKTVTESDFKLTLNHDCSDPIDIIYNVPRSTLTDSNVKGRYNRSLALKGKVLRPRIQAPLPIDEHRQELIEAVKNHRIVLLRAETGSGKSSRYPQFIFDHYASQGKGVDCNVVVSQPRRLTAVSLAHHVAKERNEELGDVVGYSVRIDSMIPRPPGGSILYCTAGKLLQSLLMNPSMKGVSHICLDEVHERQFDCDMIMALAKRCLQDNPNIHLTLMSATLNAEELKKYFGQDCYVFDAPGRTFPVKTHFLEDIPKQFLRKYEEKDEIPMIVRIVQWLDQKPPGAILVFLPGWKEILSAFRLLKRNERLSVIPLHSSVPLREQMKVHERAPAGKRKVVLATNIAESSITIGDVTYVVDFPFERIGRYSYEWNEVTHHVIPSTQSRLIQRRGRAGRTRPGECYHLMKKEEFANLPMYPKPGIVDMSLDYPILLSTAFTGENSIENFFNNLLTPPHKDRLQLGLKSLQELGALEEDEKITPLGTRLLCFGLMPRAAKAMVLSSVFSCENAVAAYTSISDFFPLNVFSKSDKALKSVDIHRTSDHLALLHLFELWLETRKTNKAWEKFIYNADINLPSSLCDYTYKYLLSLLNRLKFARMEIDEIPSCLEIGQLHHEEFLKAILLNVHGSLALVKKRYMRGGVPVNKQRIFTLSGKILTLSPQSVNSKKRELPAPYLLHLPSVDTGYIVHTGGTSLMSPLSVLLFMPGHPEVRPLRSEEGEEKKMICFNNQIKMELSESDCNFALKLREAIWESVDYFVRKEGSSERLSTGYAQIHEFRGHLIELLKELLESRSPNSDLHNIEKSDSGSSSDSEELLPDES